MLYRVRRTCNEIEQWGNLHHFFTSPEGNFYEVMVREVPSVPKEMKNDLLAEGVTN